MGDVYDQEALLSSRTQMVRDELTAELVRTENDVVELHVYCHVSGVKVAPPFSDPNWRAQVFEAALPVALSAIHWADRDFFRRHPEYNRARVMVGNGSSFAVIEQRPARLPGRSVGTPVPEPA